MTFSIAPPPPAKTADNQLVETDYAGLSPVNDLSKYRDLFFSAPAIGAAIGYASLPSDVRDDLWAEFDYAETNDEVRDVARPATYPTEPFTVGNALDPRNLTRAEAVASWVAKIAHAMYHEIAGTFPWSIATYSEEWMRDLLDPDLLYSLNNGDSSWDLSAPGGVAAGIAAIFDVSPNLVYAKVQPEYTPALTARQAIGNIHDNIGRTMTHVQTGEAANALDMIDQFSASNLRGGQYISRRGCPTASRLMVAFARCINIPGHLRDGYYAIGYHDSCDFKSANLTLAHGDDIYTNAFTYHYGDKVFESYADYAANVYTLSPNTSEVEAATLTRTFDRRLSPIGSYYRQQFRLFGWGAVYYQFSTWVTDSAKLDKLYYDLVQLEGVDGGGGPEPPAGTVTVDAGAFFLAASWSLSPDPGGGNDTGTGNASFSAPPASYTLTWLDTFPGKDPPTPATEGPTVLATDGNISFGPPGYVDE